MSEETENEVEFSEGEHSAESLERDGGHLLGDEPPATYYQRLFEHMECSHGLILLESEMHEIERIVLALNKPKPIAPKPSLRVLVVSAGYTAWFRVGDEHFNELTTWLSQRVTLCGD